MIDDLLSVEFCASIHWDYGAGPLSWHHRPGPFVYYIQSGPVVKIGNSAEPELRVDQIRRGGRAKRPSMGLTEEPRLLAYTPGDARAEQAMHDKFAHLRDQGEWFRLDVELAEHIRQAQQVQARLEVEAHIAYYERRVQSHGWPPATHDAAARTAEQLAAKEPVNIDSLTKEYAA